MADGIRWRQLGSDEWPRLEAFLHEVYGDDVELELPDPALSTVIVLVNADDEIAAAMSMILRPVIGPVAVGPVDQETIDTLLSSGIEEFRALCEENGIRDQVVISFNDAEKDFMEELGFVNLNVGAYIGNF